MNEFQQLDGFGGGMITGTWYNPKTKKKVTVRDSYLDGEDMVILCTNGESMSMNEFSNFIQITNDDDIKELERGNATSKEDILFEGMGEKPSQPNFGVISQLGDESLIKQTLETIKEPKPKENTKPTDSSLSSNEMVLKVLEKSPSPKIHLSIEWEDYPSNEMNMLKNIFNITDEQISNTILNKYCTLDVLKEAFQKYFCNI